MHILEQTQQLLELLDAKYGGGNWANMEYFNERSDLEQWCLTRATSWVEYNLLVEILDPHHVFNIPLLPGDWSNPSTVPETIPNWAGTLYEDRQRLVKELWGTNTKGEHNLVKTPLLELWEQSKNIVWGLGD